MNRKQKIIISVTGIFIVLITLLGLTFAFFLTQIRGNEKTKSISVTTENLLLKYDDGDGYIIGYGEEIEPGATFKKTFSVSNEGNAKIDNYAVILEDVKTFYAAEFKNENDQTIAAGTPVEFKRPEDFELVIICTKKDGTSCNGMNGTLPLMENKKDSNIKYITNGVLVTNSIEVDDIHTYEAILTYKNVKVDQSADMNKKLEGKFNIIDANNTIDITGTVASYNPRDIVQTNSVKRSSQINSDGTYKIVGLEAGIHSIKLGTVIEEEDGTKKEQLTEISKLSIKKGNVASTVIKIIDGERIPQVTIVDSSRAVTVNIEEDNAKLEGPIIDYSPYYIPFNDGTLAYSILNNAKSGNPGSTVYTLSNELPTTIAEKHNKQNEKILSYTQDDLGLSYYYRGNVIDNYVNFAGMCWRIVRIAGDGSIKLILEDQYTTCNDNESVITSAVYTGNWHIGVGIKKPSFGFTLSDINNDSKGETYASFLQPKSSIDSSMVKAFYDFQTNQLKDYTDKMKSGNWCLGDKAYASEDDNTTPLEDYNYYSDMYYDSYIRLYGKNTKEPTLKCNGTVLNEFADVKDVSSISPMYVGAITADEVVYAGGISSTTANLYYYLLNDYHKNLSNAEFFTLSLFRFYALYRDTVYAVSNKGGLFWQTPSMSYDNLIRPSVSLKSGITATTNSDTATYGEPGTINNPYVIN